MVTIVALLGLSASSVLTDGSAVIGSLVSIVVTTACQLQIARSMPGQVANQRPTNGALTLIAFGIVSGAATVLGFLLLIVPGILLLVRWTAAMPALLILDLPITQALRWSWKQTRVITASIFIVSLLTIIPPLLCVVLLAFTTGASRWQLNYVAAAMTSIMLVASWYLSFAIFEAVRPPLSTLQDVFA